MQNAILIGVSRQMSLARELDVIANNVANVTTNGFKARSSRFQEYMMPKASAEGFPRADRRLSYVTETGTPLDISAGAMERTGNPLDVAINGDGFLAVQTPGGERYTRNGALQINAQGQLVTSDGHAVMGDNGPISLSPQERNVAIAQDGTVSTDQGQRGKVRLVRFANVQSLQNVGANLFTTTAQAQPAGNTSRLEPGMVERSNVRPVLEMSRLIEVNRTYTTVSGMVQRLDELKRSAIQRLAEAA